MPLVRSRINEEIQGVTERTLAQAPVVYPPLEGSQVPGQEARGVWHFIEEIHEIGESLIPVFLILHVGAVILHALFGRHLWKRMIFLKE